MRGAEPATAAFVLGELQQRYGAFGLRAVGGPQVLDPLFAESREGGELDVLERLTPRRGGPRVALIRPPGTGCPAPAQPR